MKVQEYLSKIGIKKDSSKQMCFVIGKVFEENGLRTIYYRSSPLRNIWEWFDYLNHSANPESNILNYNVINTKQNVVSWMSGADWNPAINNGRFISLLVMSDEELSKAYSNQQWKNTLEYIDRKIEEEIKK